MSDNFYEIENNPTTGEDVARVADVASAQELASMEDTMINREVELKETYEQGTEQERNNLEIADGLAKKYPHAFEQTILPDGSKVTVFKNYLIPEFNNKYNIVTDPDNLFSQIDPVQRSILTKGFVGSEYNSFIFSKEGFIQISLNMNTGQFNEPYFKPTQGNLQAIIDNIKNISKRGGFQRYTNYGVELKVNNGRNNITASTYPSPLSLADPRFRDMNDLGPLFENMGYAFKVAEIIGEKKEESEKLSPEEILNLLP